MRFIDLDLARRLEMAEAYAGRACAEACQRFHPEHSVAIEEIAGGIAVFAGVDSPITQAIGVGLNGPVSDAQVDALGEFFHSRKAPAAVELCPLVEPSLYEKFAARNYHLLELTDVLILDDLAAARIPGALPPGVTVRVSEPHEAKLWTQTVAQGFAEHYPVTQAMLDVMEGFYGRRDGCFFLAFVDGIVAGGAGVFAGQGVGGLFGASTLPAFRRRGVQAALLAARLAWAVEKGCDLAVSFARPGSISHRNIERNGFRVAYTRTKLVLPPSQSQRVAG
ncbi:MAG: GNAT family N-acetyltransferase [Candidatus Acidiferrales bacterium]|jgi:GNAT superfamily N-acetyltransferase